MFRKEEKVVCINKDSYTINVVKNFRTYEVKTNPPKHITIGKEYTIIDIKDNKICVIDDTGFIRYYSQKRFLSKHKYKIKKIRYLLNKLKHERN